MADPREINADMLALLERAGRPHLSGPPGAHGQHVDAGDGSLARLCRATRWRADIGRRLRLRCPTLEFARAVGPTGRVAALDISGPMLAEGAARAKAAGIANVDWRQADPATAALDEYDVLTSAFGTMFFGDPVGAFAHVRCAANADVRMAIVCWRSLAENPRMEVPMNAVARHVPPRPKPVPHAPGMFAFADPERVSEVLTASAWAPPGFEKLDADLDIAAGRGLEEAVVQSTQIGAVNSWLRNQPAEVVSVAIASLREALEPYVDGTSVRLPGAMWLISSASA